MGEYQQSRSLVEVRAKHPFPWIEQRGTGAFGGIVRLIDADGVEVNLFEITALCRLYTQEVESQVSKQSR